MPKHGISAVNFTFFLCTVALQTPSLEFCGFARERGRWSPGRGSQGFIPAPGPLNSILLFEDPCLTSYFSPLSKSACILKARVEKLYGSFGLSVTDAINIFLHVSLMEGGLPFEVRQPRYNAETEAAIEETRKIMDGSIPAKRYTSVDDMFNDALAEDTVHA